MKTQTNRNIIELNGNRYDAQTGQLLHTSAPVHASRRNIDGVVGTHAALQAATLKPAPVTKVAAKPAQTLHQPVKHPAMDITRRPAHPAARHQPQHSKTLMRHAVNKPQPGLKRHLKAQTRTDILAKQPTFLVAPKLSFESISPQRLNHAKRIARSQLISKFGTIYSPSTITVTAASAAVSTAPHITSAPVSVTPKPAKRPVVASSPRSMDIFERALATATSHEQPPVEVKKHRHANSKTKKHSLRKGVSIAAASLAILLLAGFVVYQNKAMLTARLASSRAGFHVSLPGYRPAGYAVGSIAYSPGVAAVNFTSHGQDFQLIQKPSTWDSQALLNNFVSLNNASYQAFESAGRTIYIYGNGNATWVDNGVWYQIKDANGLTDVQLVQIATSL